MKTFKVLVALIFAVAFLGCDASHDNSIDNGQDSPQDITPLELEENAMNVLTNHCGSCHDSGTGLGGFDSIMDIDQMILEGLIIPGNSNQSPLYTQMENGQMPPSGPVSAAELEAVRVWIDEGFKGDEPPASTVTYQEVQDILDNNCTSCHGNSGEIKLESYDEVLKVVIPGKPDESLLYDSIKAGRMPKVGDSLSDEEITLIYDWIVEGAQP